MRTFLKNGKGIEKVEQWESNCWINIEVPNEQDKAYLLDELQVPEAFYEDIEDVDERPRIEIEDGWTLIIMRLPYKGDDKRLPFSTVPLGLVFKDDMFISLCFHKTEVIDDFIVHARRKSINYIDFYDLAFRLMLSSSVWFLKHLKQIRQNIDAAETKLETSIRNEDLQTLLRIEKCLVFFTTSMQGNDILIHRFANSKVFKHTIDNELMEDVEIELRQALETTHIYSTILSGTMDAYASVVSNNLNVIMKRLTSISIIFMIPTLIASLYGMNVPNFLEENNYGLAIVIIGSLILSFIVVVLFRRKKWF